MDEILKLLNGKYNLRISPSVEPDAYNIVIKKRDLFGQGYVQIGDARWANENLLLTAVAQCIEEIEDIERQAEERLKKALERRLGRIKIGIDLGKETDV